MRTVVYNLFAPNLICIGIDGGNNGEYSGRIWRSYECFYRPELGINIQMSLCPFKEL